MKYYKMMYNGNLAEDRNYASCLKVDLNGIDDQIIYHGKNITKHEWQGVTFHCNLKEGTLTNWLGNIYNWELFSEDIVHKLCPLIGHAVQFLPANVVDEQGFPLKKEYYIMNVLNVLPFESLNKEKSDFLCFEIENNLYYNIAKYAFYRDSLINQDIFRLENDMYALFVSENVRKIVRKMKWEEFGFLEVDII